MSCFRRINSESFTALQVYYESYGSLKRADIIIQNNKDKNIDVLPVLKI
ncbi:MAG: hypothetical protein R3A12_13650 [Ignavibacteria bacterium]